MQKKEVRSMSRTKGIPNRYHAPEFKLELVREVLSGKILGSWARPMASIPASYASGSGRTDGVSGA